MNPLRPPLPWLSLWPLLLGLVSAPATAMPPEVCGGLRAESAWARQPPPGSQVVAGYLILRNDTETSIRVTGVESPDFEHAMMHETRVADGRARMRHLAAVEIPAGTSVSFEPGGAHIMLSRPQLPLGADTRLAVQLHCDSGQPLTVWLPLLRQAPQRD